LSFGGVAIELSGTEDYVLKLLSPLVAGAYLCRWIYGRSSTGTQGAGIV